MNQHNYLQSGWLLYGVNAMSTIRSIQTYYESYHFSYHYRPQRSCGKVMFLHLSVCHSVHRGRHAWGACVVGGMRDRGVRVTGGMHVGKGEGVVGLHGRRDCSGWYASYWNAFLFPIEFFAVFTKMIDVTFLPMLYTWTNASILSYVTSVICWRFDSWYLWTTLKNNSELHKR